jgi:hypothetical protein
MPIEQILTQILNIGGETQWIPVEGLFSLNEVTLQNFALPPAGILGSTPGLLQPRRLTNFNPSGGLVVKVFMNQRTGELKTFLAKTITNLPGRESL